MDWSGKSLNIPKLDFDTEYPGLDEISKRLDELNSGIPVDIINWKEFDYRPEVKFSIAYTNREILLKYYITEDFFKAEMTETNQMVCEDSCVEFFISPADDGIYYNMEFNAIGTCLMGSGTGRADNIKAGQNIVSAIRRKTSAGTESITERAGTYSWDITLAIPAEVFYNHHIKDFQGRTFRANFYKCGDKLTVPHYLTWNPVGTVKPDYHRPEFFGSLKFL